MNKKVYKAYKKLFEILQRDCHNNYKAYDRLLEFLAVDNAPILLNR